MNIDFSYPSWFVALCVLLGIGYAFAFYYKERLLSDVSKWRIIAMGTLRFSVTTILALLLLKPLVANESEKIEKPIIVIAQDNSQSIVLNKDSSFYRNEYQTKLNNLVAKLSDKYEVRALSFGEQLSDGLLFSFDEKQTAYNALFEDIYAKYYGRNLGAIIIASDGVFNKGQNPLYNAKGLKKSSIYTIALGDTAKRKDLAILNVVNNKIAYLGNDFPIEVVVASDYFKGKKSIVSILKNGTIIKSQTLEIKSDNEVFTIPFKVEAKKSGKQKYVIQITPLDGEFTKVNNNAEVFIDILDSKQKILIVSAAPHPDVAAIKNAIEKNINYKVEVVNIMDYNQKLEDYNLVILHQVPSVNGGENKLLAAIKKTKIPVLFFTGSKSNYAAFNALETGLKIVGPKGTTDTKPSLNTSFISFKMDETLKNLFPQLPPVQIPFAGDYKTSIGVNILLYQKIGSTKTTYPLLSFNEKNGQKTGVFLGEGIWKWKFQDFIKNNNTNAFETLLSKVVQFLAVKEDKNRFKVKCNGEFLENEAVIFQAELYNDIYELVNDAEVLVEIVNDKGEAYPQKAFAKVGQSYRLDAGLFSPGSYTYTARTNYNGKKFEIKGEFVIKELKVEYLDAVADHSLLYNLAEKTGGKMYSKDDFSQILTDIENDNNVAAVKYINNELTDIIKWKWILFLIIGLLSIEWFMRKRNGAY